jgi:cell wall-associated NlpC family hydrolase
VSQRQVAAAEAAVGEAVDDVAGVQAQLATAQASYDDAQAAAAKAAEELNGATYRAEQAQAAHASAETAAAAAADVLAGQRSAYADAVVSAYQMSPQLGALASISEADGATEVMERTEALRNAEGSLQERLDAYDAASVEADAARTQAAATLEDATAAQQAAEAARDEARESARSAREVAASYAADRARLVSRLARLQGISDGLAATRQVQLEQAAAEAAAQAAAEQAAQQAAQQSTPTAEIAPTTPTVPATPVPTPVPTPTVTPTAPAPTTAPTTAAASPTAEPTPTAPTSADPTPTDPTPTETAAPTTPPPPASSGAQTAIAFARAQIGEPYRYGAAGPTSWDCSGLTMQAWAAAGVSLPHYSGAQYADSAKVDLDDLQPGDLLFWGSGPSSIYHVALYVGDGRMIHAPRPGRSVEEVSMYYWIAPTMFARPH